MGPIQPLRLGRAKSWLLKLHLATSAGCHLWQRLPTSAVGFNGLPSQASYWSQGNIRLPRSIHLGYELLCGISTGGFWGRIHIQESQVQGDAEQNTVDAPAPSWCVRVLCTAPFSNPLACSFFRPRAAYVDIHYRCRFLVMRRVSLHQPMGLPFLEVSKRPCNSQVYPVWANRFAKVYIFRI